MSIGAFRDRGHKLLMWHGWADQMIMPQARPALCAARTLNATVVGKGAIRLPSILVLITPRTPAFHVSICAIASTLNAARHSRVTQSPR